MKKFVSAPSCVTVCPATKIPTFEAGYGVSTGVCATPALVIATATIALARMTIVRFMACLLATW